MRPVLVYLAGWAVEGLVHMPGLRAVIVVAYVCWSYR